MLLSAQRSNRRQTIAGIDYAIPEPSSIPTASAAEATVTRLEFRIKDPLTRSASSPRLKVSMHVAWYLFSLGRTPACYALCDPLTRMQRNSACTVPPSHRMTPIRTAVCLEQNRRCQW